MRCDYESKIVNDMKDNPKRFHGYIRGMKVGCPTVGPLECPRDGSIISESKMMTEMFADAFSKVHSAQLLQSPQPHQYHQGTLTGVTIEESKIDKLLGLLDKSSSMGPDGVHPFILKRCQKELIKPLSMIFNVSLMNGTLPEIWKTANIKPIFKGGSRKNPLNYRPVSLTSVPCKLMERIISEHLLDYLESNHLLTEDQFGFRPNRSTEDQLLLTYDEISSWLNDGFAADLVLLDFAKAFDVVNHKLLIDKLRLLGLKDQPLYWIIDFLNDRTSRVSISGASSQPFPVVSGVPQGSVLGPILFLIFINSVVPNTDVKVKLFADDLKVYCKIDHSSSDSITASMNSLQNTLNKIYVTSTSWGLSFNTSKCIVLRFGRGVRCTEEVDPSNFYKINEVQIKVAGYATDLGVKVDDNLKFHMHIRETTNKAWSLASNLLRTIIRFYDTALQVSHPPYH